MKKLMAIAMFLMCAMLAPSYAGEFTGQVKYVNTISDGSINIVMKSFEKCLDWVVAPAGDPTGKAFQIPNTYNVDTRKMLLSHALTSMSTGKPLYIGTSGTSTTVTILAVIRP